MSDPFTTTVFAGINTVFKLAEFGLSLGDASEESLIFCRLVERVRKDRAEAVRERREKYLALEVRPLKKEWIDGAIHDIDMALYTIGKLVESARSDVEQGQKMSLVHRFEWVLSRKEGFLTKQSLLATCHLSLSNALMYMQNLPFTYSSGTVAAYPSGCSPAEHEQEIMLRSPMARRPKQKPQYMLPLHSSPSIASDFSGKHERTLQNVKIADQCKDEWVRTFSETPSLSFGEDTLRERDDLCLHEIASSEALNATATTQEEAGKILRTDTLISEFTPSSQPNERRRRNEARFRYP